MTVRIEADQDSSEEPPQALTRAHAGSGERNAVASHLGEGDNFDRTVADVSYSDLNKRDYVALREAVNSGRIRAGVGT